MCDFDGFEEWRTWSWSWQVARRAHSCRSCGGAIRPGDRYCKLFYVTYDGEPHSEKSCWPCEAVNDAFADVHGLTVAPNDLPHMLRECVGDAGRGYWSEWDKAWRGALAGMLRRKRAASRTAPKEGPGTANG